MDVTRRLVICGKCHLRSFSRWTSSYSSKPSDEPIYSPEKETHFGFETVSEQEKAEKVKTVFENVAQKYDVMNDWMSAGVHRVWKDMFIHRLNPGPKTKLIDVAGGTGDIAFRFLKYQEIKPNLGQNQSSDSNSRLHTSSHSETDHSPNLISDERTVLVSDINGKMLEVGKGRAAKMLTEDQQKRTGIDLKGSIDLYWLEADAENLYSIEDESFDAYTIAFGIRNCVHIDQVLSEAYRVLKPGGRFMCLEFSHVTNPAVKWAYDQYSFQIIPVMGQIIAGDWDSYEYLVQSIRKFPTQDEFKRMIEVAGFRFVTYENLTFGVSSIHSGFKL